MNREVSRTVTLSIRRALRVAVPMFALVVAVAAVYSAGFGLEQLAGVA